MDGQELGSFARRATELVDTEDLARMYEAVIVHEDETDGEVASSADSDVGYVDEELRGWLIDAIALLMELQSVCVVSPDADPASIWLGDDLLAFRDDVVADGDSAFLLRLDELARVRRSSVALLTLAGVVETAIEWAAAGVVGNFAWHLAEKLTEQSVRQESMTLEPEHGRAFAEQYLAGLRGVETDLVLIGQTERRWHQRSGRRTWVPSHTWRFVFVAPTVEYTVLLSVGGDHELPQVAEISERMSPIERYDELRRTGRWNPPLVALTGNVGGGASTTSWVGSGEGRHTDVFRS